MSKSALCIKDLQSLQNAITTQNDETPLTVEAQFVSREICEVADNGFTQIIPYLVLYNMDLDEGRLTLVGYNRFAGIDEQRLAGKGSCGFGGHIDLLSDLTYTSETDFEEDGVSKVAYNLTYADLAKTCRDAAMREFKEETGLDIAVEDNVDGFILPTQSGDDVEKVHLGALILRAISKEEMDAIVNNTSFNPDEIESMFKINVVVKYMVEAVLSSHNQVKETLMEQLHEAYNLERWSLEAVSVLTSSVISQLLNHLSYEDLVAVYRTKEALAMSQQPVETEEEDSLAQA